MKRTTATGSVGGMYVDRNIGAGTPGTLLIAEDRNNIQEELCNAITQAGFTLNGADQAQLAKSIVAMSKPVGELFYSFFEKATDEFFPAIAIDIEDKEISASNYPDLVPLLRGQQLDVGGSKQFTASVSGSVVTFTSGILANSLLAMLYEDALCQGDGETPEYSGWRALNIGGTDYAITDINIASLTITVDGTPASGTQTIIVYPHRIAGSTTTARLYRNGSRVLTAQGDDDNEFGAGLRRVESLPNIRATGAVKGDLIPVGGAFYEAGNEQETTGNRGPYSVGFNASLSSSIYKDNAHVVPRATSGYLYIWAGRYIAS